MYDVAIMQPTYFPWAGYFNLISNVSTFIFLDDVQFSKSSWQSRNRICNFGMVQWISQPIEHCGLQNINEVRIRTAAKWPKKHVNQLQAVYGKAPYYGELKPIIAFLSEIEMGSLASVNIMLIKEISRLLDLECQFKRSSDLDTSTERSQRLLELIKGCGGVSYLSPEGSREYLENDAVLQMEGIEVAYQEFIPEKYTQYRCDEWHSHLSIIDVIANIGLEDAKKYVRGIRNGI